jgi:hypothetical protein
MNAPARFRDFQSDRGLLAMDWGINTQALGYVEDAWKGNIVAAIEAAPDAIGMALQRAAGLGMDAQPQLITVANAGIPAFLTNLIDPQVIRVLVAPMRSEEIYGSAKKGDWTLLSTQFPIVESAGEVTSYGDFNNNGNASANINWVSRQSYHFQTVTQWGERELAMYGVAQINYASEQNIASALVINKFMNKVNFFGMSGLLLYGALNDPNLIAPVLPTVKAAGGYTWAVAIAAEIYSDVLKLYTQLNTQMTGILDMNANLTLALSTTIMPYLHKVSAFNVTALQTIKENFPNLRIVAAPEFSLPSGELMQLILNDVDGVTTTLTAFTEKMRAHPVIPELSSFKQKKSAGTWGFIGRRPVAISQMQGM